MLPDVDVTDSPREVFRRYLAERGLKASRQRDIIAEVFFAAKGHLKVEQLMAEVHQQDAHVSQATIYRTLKLLVECGLAEPRHFLDGQTRYERGEADGEHHDHLICTQCETILEFVDPRIEQLQEEVAVRHGYVLRHHKMELYGLCSACTSDAKAS